MKFADKKYTTYTAAELRPTGWLKRQLEIQADSLSGNLDKIWPDVRDSKWVGGDREGWERVPYWLDGFIPLAYLLDSDDMKARAKRYIDAILAGQKPDGWICPCTDEERGDYDMWALFLMCKVLALYADFSGDERIPGAIERALKNLVSHIELYPIQTWGKFRWFECLIPIYWLYERTGEGWLLDLAETLHEQGADYKAFFENFEEAGPRSSWNFETHVVNQGMAIKSGALYSRISGNIEEGEAVSEHMLQKLFKYHGTAVGHFSGDEILAGDSPIQGTELCGVVEAMYSYEELFALTGNPVWLDRLETLAYNALPATISPDMWTHQYDQMVNQVACVRLKDKLIFTTNGHESHMFGLEPNYGCCTANFNQGWPKFALNTFLKGKDSILSAALAPAELHTTIDGVDVAISFDTMYPFRAGGKYTVKTSAPVTFAFEVHIPAWAKNAKLDGKSVESGKICRIERCFDGECVIALEMEFDAVWEERPRDMAVLRRGPLYYSVAIEEEWKMHEYESGGVERKFPYCDYEIYPKSKWNYAFAGDIASVRESDIVDFPFSSLHPPVTLTVPMVEIDWGMEPEYNDICAKVPASREPLTDPYEVVMKPYGCTNIRMTEMPKLG